MNEKIKPQLHQSHLQMLYRCGEKFRRVVLESEREPSTIPLVVGTATHSAVAKNLQNKMNRGLLLPREAVQDFSKDDFVKEWNSTQIVLNEKEKDAGLEKTKAFAQDQTIALVTAHHYELAPRIQPIALERKWVLEAKDYDFDMAGTIDIDEEITTSVYVDGLSIESRDREFFQAMMLGNKNIRDTKTCKANRGQNDVDNSEQYTFYALWKFSATGKLPDYVIQDNIIKPSKPGGDARCFSYRSTRTKDDLLIVMKRFDQATKIIKAGIFTPANPLDWWCSKQFCGFAAEGSCPYFNSKSRNPTDNPITKEGVESNGKSRSFIESLKRTVSENS